MYADDIFSGCWSLKHVDLVEGAELHETVASLHLEGWRNDMNEEIDSINQILLNTPAGNGYWDPGGKAEMIGGWIGSVLYKIVRYKAEHRRVLDEAATTLQFALPRDILMNNVLSFLALPAYTFEGEI